MHTSQLVTHTLGSHDDLTIAFFWKYLENFEKITTHHSLFLSISKLHSAVYSFKFEIL